MMFTKGNFIKLTKSPAGIALAAIFIVVFCAAQDAPAATKKRYENWKGVAADMAVEFEEAQKDIQADRYKDAYKHVNDAYFGYYEVQGFEKNVMVAIAAERVNHIEGQFSAVKHILLGNEESTKEDLLQQVEGLKIKVYKDAMVLDGDIDSSEPDSAGEALYADTGMARPELAAWRSGAETVGAKPAKKRAPASREWVTFLTAFGLLVREGLEAILVIAAIVAYLIKTGNRQMLKGVYGGSLAAILASVVLALILQFAMGEQSGVARELLEGWTMFLAVAVLFYVSNWMLSKADTIAWTSYINEKVQQSIDKKSQWTLIFDAFIAVMREGAELILFYQAAFTARAYRS